MSHVPVLLNEVIEGLSPKAGDTFVDGTFGGGGHSQAIVSRLGPSGHLIALDVDPIAIAAAREIRFPCRVDLIQGNFRKIFELVSPLAVQVDGILLDLGFRSDQLEAGKGLSFQRDEPLSMTLGDPALYPFTAHDIVNDWDEENLRAIIANYGEEQYANRIAKAVVKARGAKVITSTLQLATVIEKAVPVWYRHRRLHPATKTFQALRMTVNDELQALEDGLVGAWKLLRPSGRLGVISFHGLEARVIKKFYKQKKFDDEGIILTKKAVTATYEEVRRNPRSRSAELRIISKK